MSGDQDKRLEISATVLTYNSERHLKDVLAALYSVGEIVVLDCGSSDRTREIALSFDNAQFFETPIMGFGALHSRATKLARFNWILSIDSDEIPSLELMAEIQALSLNPEAIYAFRRDNFFNGKRIWSCGWSPDWVFRLYHRRKAGFDDRHVHEKVCGPGLIKCYLQGRVAHEPYPTPRDFLIKMERYAALFAEQNRNKRKATLWTALLHGWYAFLRSYLLRGGCLQGYAGYVISAYTGQTAYYKYLLLADLNNCRIKQ